MEALVATGIGALVAAGIWLVLRERSFSVVLGLTLLSYAANLFIFAAGRLAPVDPMQLIFSIWALTQHHADFAAQIAIVAPGDRAGDPGAFLDQLYRRLLTPEAAAERIRAG